MGMLECLYEIHLQAHNKICISFCTYLTVSGNTDYTAFAA